jgi:macrodomain Ter protein organizer (MatP/YcbG family)
MDTLTEKMAKKNRSINFDEEVWKKLEILAIEENRTLNNYLETLVMRYIKEEELKRRKKIS